MECTNKQENGLLLYNSSLLNGAKIAVTYDNAIWGNMNPYYSITEEDKKRIDRSDKKLSKFLGARRSYVFTTPPEDTFIDLTLETSNSLDLNYPVDNEFQYIQIRANGAVVRRLNSSVGYIFAPADCPILLITFPKKQIFLLMHLGSIQVYQGLHLKLLEYSRRYNLDYLDACVFVSPYICKKHYTISEKKYLIYKDCPRNKNVISRFLKKANHPIFEGNRYSFDFLGMAINEMKAHFKIRNVYDPNICTYEMTRKGKLFSYEYMQELEAENKPIENYKGCFNVVIKI